MYAFNIWGHTRKIFSRKVAQIKWFTNVITFSKFLYEPWKTFKLVGRQLVIKSSVFLLN